MEVRTNVSGDTATLEVDGKLTVQTAEELQSVIESLPQSVANIDIDLANVEYIASAGLRVFVAADQALTGRGGSLRLLHPADVVMEVLDMTGLADVFSIES